MTMASIVIKDSFKAGKGGIDFSYVRPNGEVKTTRLKKKFSDTINGEKITFILPENPTAEQMLSHAEALATRYVRQHVAGQAKAASMTDAERAEARQRGLDNWNNMTAEQKAAHAEATKVNAEIQREAWKALTPEQKAAHAEKSRAAAMAQDVIEVSDDIFAQLAALG